MPHKRTNPKTFRHAKELRRNTTDAEAKLWFRLRAHRVSGVHFRRQHAIGNFIVDFCAPRRKLIIEVDGGQHLDQQEYDQERSAFLSSKGYRILRFWNHDVLKNIESVMQEIVYTLEEGKQDYKSPWMRCLVDPMAQLKQ